jgi:cytosine/uracil/thiamine/allantoin permease
VAARYVSAAFWFGVLVGVVAACLSILMAHWFLGLEYGFHLRSTPIDFIGVSV